MEGKKSGNLPEKNSVEYIKNMRDNLLIHMELQDLIAKELSEKSGVPLSTLNKILYADQSDCKLSTAVMLAKSLGISIDELVSAGTINETVLQNIITCRSLPQNAIYLIRWFINHQATLYKKDKIRREKIISVMNPLHTNNELLKVTNNFRQIDISHIPDELKFKVFFGLKLNSDYYMPYYTPHTITKGTRYYFD